MDQSTTVAPEVATETQAETPKSVATALEYADAYDRVAAFLAANPDLAERARVYSAPYTNITIPTSADAAAFIADVAKRAREFGAPVEEWIDGKHGGVKIHFGPLHVKVYTDADRVARRVVTGMVEKVEYALTFDLDGTPRKPAEVGA